MAAVEQQRQVRIDLVELKNLQTIVFDLEELKQLLLIAKRPRVRSILSREITSFESKVFYPQAASIFGLLFCNYIVF
jgi:Siah interacting protein, N terminal